MYRKLVSDRQATTMQHTIIVIVSILSFVATTCAFAPAQRFDGGRARTGSIHPRLTASWIQRHFSQRDDENSISKEEEIARLQEQIRMLQQEQEKEEAPESATSSAPVLADKRSAELERVKGKDMPFTEGDLIASNIIPANESNNGMAILPAILLAIGALVFFVAFSQVPVGQEDFAKYSVAPPTQTIDLGDLNPDKKVL